jgi:hypothetical protein
MYQSVIYTVLVLTCLSSVAPVSSEEAEMERSGIYTDDQGQSFCDIRIHHKD